MTTLTPTPTQPARPHGPLVVLEGTLLARPAEDHSHSLWRTLKTADGLVRFCVASDAPLAPWLEVGQRIRLTGRLVSKAWHDGIFPTLSVHHAIDILAMPLRIGTPAPTVAGERQSRLAAAASLIGAQRQPRPAAEG